MSFSVKGHGLPRAAAYLLQKRTKREFIFWTT